MSLNPFVHFHSPKWQSELNNRVQYIVLTLIIYQAECSLTAPMKLKIWSSEPWFPGEEPLVEARKTFPMKPYVIWKLPLSTPKLQLSIAKARGTEMARTLQ